jgi:large subunit ribosomal protein L5
MARLKDTYKSQVAPALQKKFNYTSAMAIPRLEKIVLSMGVGKAISDKKFIDQAVKDMTLLSGQKPLVCKAKKSVSNFKLREGMDIGLKVTIRRDRMYEFLDRLINLAVPRVKDFRGLSPKSFDGRGNYSMGLAEVTTFPEIDPASLQWQEGINITVVTTAKSDDEAREMLKLFGMPFREK